MAFAQTADLAFSITENSPDPLVAGQDTQDYVYTIQNGGPDDATNVVAAFLFTPANGTVFCDSGGYTPSQGTVDIPNGTWTVGTIAAGASATVTQTCAIGAQSTDGATWDVTFSLGSLDQTDGNAANDSAAEGFTVIRVTNFNLSVVCTPDTVLAGSGAGNLSCVLDLGQTGPSDASGVAVGLTLPAGVSVDSADLTNAPGTSFVSPTWTIGDAPVGYAADIALTMTVDGTASGDLTIEAGVSANETIANGPVTASDVVSAESAADAPTSFLTTIGFTNGYTGTVTVSISCNNGVPLDQSFDISPSEPVDFVVDLLDFLAPDVECTITLDAVDDGYVGSFLANGVDTGDACVFSSEPEAGEAPFNQTLERNNTCEITAEPVASTFEVEKIWEFENNDVIGMSAGIDIWCEPASATTGPSFGSVSTYVTAYGDDTFTLQFYPHWDGGATCYALESGLDSAVESDGGCSEGTHFVVGDALKGCTITNTVFFEGIPTLSQWGMAVMALLMLGLGFVGLRRFA